MKAKFNQADIRKKLLNDVQKIELLMISELEKAAVEIVSDAKNNMNIDDSAFKSGKYNDITGNLRSSIGWFILKDGEIIKREGISLPELGILINDVQIRTGYNLVVFAGMNYAAYVESRGFNVLSSQWYYYIPDLRDRLKTLAKKTRI
ncbi:MAG: HK97 gp10 family phage protein [Salinivirgaceae bacterium]